MPVMSEENSSKVGLDLSKLRSKPVVLELEGRKFEVTPVTGGLAIMMSKPSAQSAPDREVGLQALYKTLRIGGEAVSEEEIGALSKESQQQLATKVLEMSLFEPGGDDALESLGAQLKDRKSLFSMPPGFNLGETLTAQLQNDFLGISRATAAINAATLKMSPETYKAIEFASKLGEIVPQKPQINFDSEALFKAVDPTKTPQGRAAKAAEETAEHTQEMLTALGEMLQHIGGLTKTMLGDALPQWLRHIETVEQGASDTADKARRSLNWAIGSVFVSILTTVGTAAYDYLGSEADSVALAARATAVEGLLQEQINLNRQLLESMRQQGAAQSERIGALADQVHTATQLSAERSAELQERLDKLAKQAPLQSLNQ